MTDLASRWAELAGTSPEATTAGAELIRRWSEPHRHYHDVTHLAAVLDAIDVLIADGVPVIDAESVRFAAWFHDAVYEGAAGADERASAALARRVLGALGRPAPQIDEVVRLVLLTVEHDPEPGDLDGAVLCDADLAILGSGAEGYADYVHRVRQEYAHVDDDAFRAGRVAVLRKLLALDPLFHTDAGGLRWSTAATANLRTELAHRSDAGP